MQKVMAKAQQAQGGMGGGMGMGGMFWMIFVQKLHSQ
jgi:hypothetical protein